MSAYDDVTARIVAALEAGTPPWVQPWRRDGTGGSMPYNAATGRAYHGINTVLLMGAGAGYPGNGWITFKQATDAGGHVRQGEHGVPIVFWKFSKPAPGAAGDDGAAAGDDATARRAPLCRVYYVFNLAQCDRVELPSRAPVAVAPSRPELDCWIERTGAEIRHGGDRAYYSPVGDYVQMPNRSAFPDQDHYYSTALHELTHWTGGERRLAREFGRRFGDSAYAVEELIAEMGSAFLCSAAGVPLETLQHPAYLGHWVKVLRADNRAIFTAARAAQTAADYLIAKMTGKEAEPEALAA